MGPHRAPYGTPMGRITAHLKVRDPYGAPMGPHRWQVRELLRAVAVTRPSHDRYPTVTRPLHATWWQVRELPILAPKDAAAARGFKVHQPWAHHPWSHQPWARAPR